MGKFSNDILQAAHDSSFGNEEALKEPQQCGCFFCMETFPSSEIKEYADDSPIGTAICPYCGVDSVIGEKFGYPIDSEFLQAMNRRWFDSQEESSLKQATLFSGTIRKMQLRSIRSLFCPYSLRDEEMEQRITINNQGRIWFSGYSEPKDNDQPTDMLRSCQSKIDAAAAQNLFALIAQYFSEDPALNLATDAGEWYLILTNTENQKFRFYGSLCSDLILNGSGLSDKIRETLGMRSLLAFDGCPEGNAIDRVEIEYHRTTQAIQTDAIEIEAEDYREELTIDRTAGTLVHIQTMNPDRRITQKIEAPEAVEELLEQFDPDELFRYVNGSPTDAVEDQRETREYQITVDYENGASRKLCGSFDKDELPLDFDEFAGAVSLLEKTLGVSEILDKDIIGRSKRRESDYIYCTVSFEDGGRHYYYISDDERITAGDWVVVPVGKDNQETVVQVEKVEYFSKDNVPFPVEKTKHILRIEDPKDIIPPEGGEWHTFCPAIEREIGLTECVEISDVADDMIKESILEDYECPVHWTEDMAAICKKCKYHMR